MVFRGFWKELKKPIIGLSPMDGVTDAPFRTLTAMTSHPAVTLTEFTNVEGLARGATSMLTQFRYSEIERPVVAQIYGIEIDSYYQVALMACHLGFDGIDINMGCPMNKIAKRGSGAGLIRTPELAKTLIRTVQKATQDWANGITLAEAQLRPKVITALKAMRPEEGARMLRPVSVKTRVGYDEEIAEEWVQHLLEAEPANITMHGRTLKQMYTGSADWEALGRAAKVCKTTETSFLGNGDVSSLVDAKEKIAKYDLDGVLVGRATYGNPWFFSGYEPTQAERLAAAIEHCELYEKLLPDRNFCSMKKHLGWYAKGFDGAKELRMSFMREANSAADVRRTINEFSCGNI